jgi:hypothetical protein
MFINRKFIVGVLMFCGGTSVCITPPWMKIKGEVEARESCKQFEQTSEEETIRCYRDHGFTAASARADDGRAVGGWYLYPIS